MKVPQRTIHKRVEHTGLGVNSGRQATLRLCPAPPDTGVVFVRVDLPGAPTIPAVPDHLAPKFRRTVLQRGEAEVQMTEHLLAAASGLGIDNLRVELKGSELPACDGSARVFAQMLQDAGIEDQPKPRVLRTLREPVTVSDEHCSITASPATEGLHLSYVLEYGQLPLPRQEFEIDVTPESFVAELAPARTFVFQREAASLIASGLGRGASLENTLVIRDDGSLVYGELRFPNEFARHKTVDLIGDLRLLGSGLCARVAAARSGHAQNLQLVEQLRSALVEILPNL